MFSITFQVLPEILRNVLYPGKKYPDPDWPEFYDLTQLENIPKSVFRPGFGQVWENWGKSLV